MSLLVDIQKYLGGFQLNISFQTEDIVTGLLGVSGCGKSMTLQCIAGIQCPDRGRIVLDDVVLFDSDQGINLPPQQRSVGYLFQNYALFPHMTVEKNLRCGLVHGMPEKLTEMMKLLGLEGLEAHYPHQLSGGQCQRVALGRMLLSQPKLLLLDEPFSALDGTLRQELQLQLGQLLKQVSRQTILVTHDRQEAYHLCTKLCILEAGHIVQLGETRAVFCRPTCWGSAQMVGYQNLVSAQWVDDHHLFLPSWGISLTTAEAVTPELCGIAIHQRSFQTTGAENPIPVTVVDGMDTPDYHIALLRTLKARENTTPIRWQVEGAEDASVTTLWLSPSDILPLYPPEERGVN